jgi:hypothetical protein
LRSTAQTKYVTFSSANSVFGRKIGTTTRFAYQAQISRVEEGAENDRNQWDLCVVMNQDSPSPQSLDPVSHLY